MREEEAEKMGTICITECMSLQSSWLKAAAIHSARDSGRPGRAPPGTRAAAGQRGTGAHDPAASSARLAPLLCAPRSWSRPSRWSWRQQREVRGRSRLPGPLERARGRSATSAHSTGQRGSRSRCGPGQRSRAAVSSEGLQAGRRGRGAERPSAGLRVPRPSRQRGRFSGCALGNRPLQGAPGHSAALSPFGAPAYFPPSSAAVSSLFRPPQTSGVPGSSRRSLQGAYLWGQQWEEACLP